jgi:hypothetical protein
MTKSRRLSGVAFARERSSSVAFTSDSLIIVLDVRAVINRYAPIRKKGKHSVYHFSGIFSVLQLFAMVSASNPRVGGHVNPIFSKPDGRLNA